MMVLSPLITLVPVHRIQIDLIAPFARIDLFSLNPSILLIFPLLRKIQFHVLHLLLQKEIFILKSNLIKNILLLLVILSLRLIILKSRILHSLLLALRHM